MPSTRHRTRAGKWSAPPTDGRVPRPVAYEAMERAAPQKVLVIACGMLAREVLAVKERLGLAHLDLTCLPAELHFHPDRIPAAIDRAIEKARADGYDDIFIGYADCGTGGLLDKVLEKHGVARLAGPHCFAFYQGEAAFAAVADADITAFYMTDFLCRQFDAFFVRPLGLAYEKRLTAYGDLEPALKRAAMRGGA